MNNGYIDLHVHSTASDGKFSPEQIIQMCKQNKVSCISLTEHYNLGSYKKAKFAANGEIEIIPGIEIGASLLDLGYSKNHICHILAYFPSYNICKILDEYEASRDICVRKTLKKIQKHIPITYSQVLKYARDKKSIGRFDIAIALSKLGYANDPVSAYGDFLDAGKSFYVDRIKMTTSELIKKIRQVHGVPVLAHPKSLKMSFTDMEIFLSKLKEYGLEGIEVYNSHHTKEQQDIFKGFAEEFELVTTVGSDFHSFFQENIHIGLGINENLKIDDYNIITELKARHSIIISN